MLFNSLGFLIFCPIVFAIYWLLSKNRKAQNIVLLLASYFFYGCWDWRFLGLIFTSSVVDYTIGRMMVKSTDKAQQKKFLYLSLFINLGILGFFKYFNFFINEFSNLLEMMGLQANYATLAIILPVGISFYTFQTLSYTIDIYKDRIKPTNDFIAFSAFVSFFPQLVAGPVERAAAFLPQFLKDRKFEYAKAIDGSKQVLWGFFKKVVIADNCALFVNDIFGYSNYGEISGLLLIVGAILFVIQLYADFSGYSDIAIGTARLFGFELMQNFNFPLFSKSITEFWRKWHISISTWFRDYLNQPLFFAVRNWNTPGVIFAILFTFGIIGFWHGANWTFIVFGLIHGSVMGIELYTRKSRKNLRKKMPKGLIGFFGWMITISVWIFSCIIFRSENMTLAANYIGAIGENLFFLDSSQFLSRNILKTAEITFQRVQVIAFLILAMFVIEWFNKNELYGAKFSFKNPAANWLFYYAILFIMFFFGEYNQEEFIYFQF